ncbi:MAG TPA: hypothetical protein P5205_05240 [Candidatus Paceibacterota bacterium]|nr:hypothetical protein [Verrucomicrobiota bacterium]HSA09759.1 hypothetical protein [Candidatus Paceibacterota bacterium]
MNRSILIVICDFLLVSLLAFSAVDISKTTREGVPRQVQTTIATNRVDDRQDLAAVMRLALEEERKGRDALLGELTQTRQAAARQQAQLRERETQVQTFREELQKKDQQVQAFQRELQQKDQQTAQLAQQQTNLLRQYVAAQTNIQSLNQQLLTSSAETLISREKLAAMQAELRKQAEQAAALQRQLGQLAQSNQLVLNEKQRLAGQLQVVEAEKRLVTEQVTRMQEEVKVERAEKAKLAEGVKTLASKSEQLAQEIQLNRPLAPNTIFSEFATNRVQASVSGVRAGFLGLESNKRAITQTVLVTDGTNTVALCHVQDTPLSFSYPGTEWAGLTGTLERNAAIIPIRALSFCQLDPRVVFMPVTRAEVHELGGKVYRISSDPYKFQDAVLVGAQEGYYGECTFQIDLTTPLYVKMDRNSLKGLFGKFNPSRGDLVFSRTGELLGIMANSTYCMMIKNFHATATFQFGADVRSQETGSTLARLYSLITQLPFKLQ